MARTILLADDSVTIQKVVELTFMDEDYEVVAVGNGDEAVAKLEEISPDLVIADVHMPGATGFDVCRATKERSPRTPVLLLVGTFEPFQEDDAAAAGADGHLKKPFDSQELLRRVDELLAEAGKGLDEAGTEDLEEVEAVEEIEAIGDFGELEGEEIEVEALDEDEGFELERSPWEEAEDTEPAAVQRADGLQNVETLGAPSDLASEDIAEAVDVERGPVPSFTSEEEDDDTAWTEPPPPAAASAAEPAEGTEPVQEPGNGLSDVDVDRIARRVAEILGGEMLRDIAWEVVPDLAEVVIKDRLRELERQVE